MNNLLRKIISRIGKKDKVILFDGEERKGMGDRGMSLGEYIKRVFRGKNEQK